MAEQAAAGRALARVAVAEPVVARAGTVVAYGALPGEPDPAVLIEVLRRRGTTVVLPRVAETGLTFAVFTGRWRPGAPTGGGLRIPEPTGEPVDVFAADVVLVPALAVDRRGVRLGQGGGYYDRTDLVRRRPRPAVVAVVFESEFVAEPLPAEPHDLRVDAVLTPGGWTWLTGEALGSGRA